MIILIPSQTISAGDRRSFEVSALNEAGSATAITGTITATHEAPFEVPVPVDLTAATVGGLAGYTISVLFAAAGTHTIRLARTDAGNEVAETYRVVVEE